MSFLLGIGVIFFYVDEGGDPHPHREPLLQGGTPLFCLSAVAVHASRWRDLDRALFQLKRAYFSREMQGFTARNPDMRPEHYEVKGRQLVKPSHAGSRRNRVFTFKILDLAQQLDVRLFAAVWRKNPANPVDAMSMYTQGLQVLAERFHHHCAQAGELGVIVADGRTRNLDFQVAASHLSSAPASTAATTIVGARRCRGSLLGTSSPRRISSPQIRQARGRRRRRRTTTATASSSGNGSSRSSSCGRTCPRPGPARRPRATGDSAS